MNLATTFTAILGWSTLIGNILIVAVFLAYVFAKNFHRSIAAFLSSNALRLGFLLASAATFGSLAYAHVTGYPACILCWIQRIFMYPEVALFGLALWRSDRKVIPYTLFLAVLGGAVALYNWVKDMLAMYTNISLACPAMPGLPSCDHIYIHEFGYITIAMLSLNAFLLIILVCYFALRADSARVYE